MGQANKWGAGYYGGHDGRRLYGDDATSLGDQGLIRRLGLNMIVFFLKDPIIVFLVKVKISSHRPIRCVGINGDCRTSRVQCRGW